MAWNFVQHVHNIIPHYHRFGNMSRPPGNSESTPTICERITLVKLARIYIQQSRAEHTTLRALNARYRQITDLKLFNVDDKVRFHRNKFDWLVGIFVRVFQPTIHVEHQGKVYPTHENKIRLFFEKQFTLPELEQEDGSNHGTIDKPNVDNHSADHARPSSP